MSTVAPILLLEELLQAVTAYGLHDLRWSRILADDSRALRQEGQEAGADLGARNELILPDIGEGLYPRIAFFGEVLRIGRDDVEFPRRVRQGWAGSVPWDR